MPSTLRILILLCLVSWTAIPRPLWGAARLPVVPGAQGEGGLFTRAAYACGINPVILRVINLNDSGPGSFRAALDDPRPRVVVFEISGTITMLTADFVASPCITIAGQTAPSPGITIKGGNNDAIIEFNTHDVLMQHLRVRPGGTSCNFSGPGAWYYGGEQAHDIVFDHLSVSWGQDEGIYTKANNVTVWRSIMSEGLYRAPESLVPSCANEGGGVSNGHGLLIYSNSQNVFVGQNVFAHNAERNPYGGTGSSVVLANNLIYNWSNEWAIFISVPVDPWYFTVVGNRLIAGPNTRADPVWGGGSYTFFYDNNNCGDWGCLVAGPGAQIYRNDNTIEDSAYSIGNVYEWNELGYDPNVGAPPPGTSLSNISVMGSLSVEDFVLSHAGARPNDRDAVDVRIINEVKSRTGSMINTPSQRGGWPTLAEIQRTLTPPANPHNLQPSGYTALEEWLHGMAADVEGTGTTSSCDVNQDGSTNVPDVQLAVNQAIHVSSFIPARQPGSADINRDGQCDVVDIQRIVNAVLGGTCVSP